VLTRNAVRRFAQPCCKSRRLLSYDGRVAHIFELSEQVILKTGNRKVLRSALCVTNLFSLPAGMADELKRINGV
jgi:hypothetical protein